MTVTHRIYFACIRWRAYCKVRLDRVVRQHINMKPNPGEVDYLLVGHAYRDALDALDAEQEATRGYYDS